MAWNSKINYFCGVLLPEFQVNCLKCSLRVTRITVQVLNTYTSPNPFSFRPIADYWLDTEQFQKNQENEEDTKGRKEQQHVLNNLM